MRIMNKTDRALLCVNCSVQIKTYIGVSCNIMCDKFTADRLSRFTMAQARVLIPVLIGPVRFEGYTYVR